MEKLCHGFMELQALSMIYFRLDWEWQSIDDAMIKVPLGELELKIIQLIVGKNKGIPLSVTVDGAHRRDKKITKETFDNIIFQRLSQDEGIQNIRMDKGI
jgi:hypothetical protein